jgi:hypothetical protein
MCSNARLGVVAGQALLSHLENAARLAVEANDEGVLRGEEEKHRFATLGLIDLKADTLEFRPTESGA